MNLMMSTTSVFVAALTFTAVLCIGGAFVAAGAAQRQRIQTRLRLRSQMEGVAAAQRSFFARVFSGIGRSVSPKGFSSGLQKQMSQAGYYNPAAGAIFMGTKTLLFSAAAAALVFATTLVNLPAPIEWMSAISLSGLMFFIPNLFLGMKISQRQLEIRRHLPDAVDLLEICVSGGMGLDQAWLAVEDQVRPVCQELANEIALTNLEIHLGADRGTAMRHMADRTGADELNSLVAVLVQSERFGTSLTDALRVFTANMRELRSQRAEESAEKMAVKMIFPMVALIFPVILIIAVGPAGITLAEILGGN
jgi:tight adherence protein C